MSETLADSAEAVNYKVVLAANAGGRTTRLHGGMYVPRYITRCQWPTHQTISCLAVVRTWAPCIAG